MRKAFILSLTIAIPYFSISKSIKLEKDLNKVLLAIVFGIFLQACIGIAESLKGWKLYNYLSTTMGLNSGFTYYLSRQNILRASGALEHPIILGFCLTIGLGFVYHLKQIAKERKKTKTLLLMIGIFVIGLIGTLSRGPWVGAAVMTVIYIITGPKVTKGLFKVILTSLLSLLVLALLPFGQKIISLLPFINNGHNNAEATITYRQELLEKSWIVIQRNPFFGSANYLNTPEMQSLKQGQGIVDIVNSYIRIALETGLIGLSIFLMIFIFTLARHYALFSSLKKDKSFEGLLMQNRVLFSVLLSIMLIIFTVSSVGVISLYYWTILALSAAFINIAHKTLFQKYYSNK